MVSRNSIARNAREMLYQFQYDASMAPYRMMPIDLSSNGTISSWKACERFVVSSTGMGSALWTRPPQNQMATPASRVPITAIVVFLWQNRI